MRTTAVTRAFRRYISGTPAVSSKPLPFEKPIFESEILNKARADKQFCERMEYYGNVLLVGVGLSYLGRLGYYFMYGKEGGAGPLPRRDRKRN